MQEAETVLNVLRERGRRGLSCEEPYRQLFNPSMYLLAYGRIYSNQGAMTPGTDGETADGMSQVKIGRIIDAMRHERYRFKPARRIYIPKKNGKERPLGITSWSDKIVSEVVRLLLEAYYEPTSSNRSHGFRPHRGCHTALTEVANTWAGTTWFIEGDISDCFGSLDHSVLLGILGEKIHDNRFLRLLRHMLQAGYLEDWTWNATHSGTPQGGVASPVLSNIYLDQLDKFVEKVLIPEYTRGAYRKFNPEYQKVAKAAERARKRGDLTAARALRTQQTSLPSKDPRDPGYRRLRYVRYADDHLLGFTGPLAEAEDIRRRLAQFLHDELALELSEEKTLITHARTRAAKFLGYEITVQHADTKRTKHQRSVNGGIALRVPTQVIKAKCAPYLTSGKPGRRSRLVNLTDHEIITIYGAEYRGTAQYYLLAGDVYKLNRLHWTMLTSLLRTLACKHDSTLSKMAARYTTTIDTPHGPRTCMQTRVERTGGRKPPVATFGGIPLKRKPTAVLNDRANAPGTAPRRRELITRLKAQRCEMCETPADVEVHHVRKLADLANPGPPHQPQWAKLMAAKRRKTLAVCASCHSQIHHNRRTEGNDTQ
jgi:group II intron reverse transcriptase/maturase